MELRGLGFKEKTGLLLNGGAPNYVIMPQDLESSLEEKVDIGVAIGRSY